MKNIRIIYIKMGSLPIRMNADNYIKSNQNEDSLQDLFSVYFDEERNNDIEIRFQSYFEEYNDFNTNDSSKFDKRGNDEKENDSYK